MIAAILLTLAQASAATPAGEAPTEEAIAKQTVVINRTMDKWKGGIFKQDGKLTCRMDTSSGDQAVDILRCGAMVGCYAPRADELDAIAASDAPKEERQEQMRAIVAEVEPCVANAHREGVRRLAMVRAAQ